MALRLGGFLGRLPVGQAQTEGVGKLLPFQNITAVQNIARNGRTTDGEFLVGRFQVVQHTGVDLIHGVILGGVNR